MAVIATAEVRVVADTSRFLSNLRRQLRGAFSGLGGNLGRELGRDISDSASREVQTGLGRVGTRAGQSFIRNFRLQADFQQTLQNLARQSFPETQFSAAGTRLAQAFGDAFETRIGQVALTPSANPVAIRRAQDYVDRLMDTMVQRANNRSADIRNAFEAGLADLRQSQRAESFVSQLINRMVTQAEQGAREAAERFNDALTGQRPQFMLNLLDDIDRRQGQLNQRMRQSGANAIAAFSAGVARAQDQLSTGINPIRMQRAGEEAGEGLLTGFRRRLGTGTARIALTFGRNLRTQMTASATNLGSNFGLAFQNSLVNRATSIGNTFLNLIRRSLGRSLESEADASGRRVGGAFGRGLSNVIRGLTLGVRGLGQALSAVSIRPLQGLAGLLRDASTEMVSVLAQGLLVVALLESLSGALFALPAALNVVGAGIATVAIAFNGFGAAISAAFDDLDAFESAIENLAPAAQSVAREIRAIAPALTDLRLDAQEALFSQIAGTVTDVAANLLGPLSEGLNAAAAAFGGIIAELGEFLSQAASANTVTATFETLVAIFDALAVSTGPFLEAMRLLADTFLPRIAEAAGPLAGLGAQFQAWTEQVVASGQAMQAFDFAIQVFTQLGGIVADLAGIFQAMFSAAELAGVDALGAIGSALEVVRAAFESFEGQVALANVFDAIGDAVNALAPVFGVLLTQLGLVFPIIAQIAEALGPSLTVVIEALGQAILALGPGIVAVFDGIAAAATAIAPALQPLGEALGAIFTAIAPLLPVIGQLIGIVVELGAQLLSVLASAIAPIVQALAGALAPILPQIADLFARLVEALAPLIAALGEGLASVISTLLPPLLQLVVALADALMPVIEALVPVITPLLDIFFQLVNVIGSLLVPVISLLLPIIQALSPLFELIGVVLAPLLELFAAILQPITTLITLLANLLTPVIQFLAEVIGAIINLALTPLTAAFEFLGGVLADYVIPWFEQSTSILRLFWELAIQPLIEWVGRLTDAISDRFGTVRSAVSTLASLWQSRFDIVMSVLESVGAVVRAAVTLITDQFSNLGDTIASIWDGITNAISNAADTISAIVDRVVGWVNTAVDAVSNLSSLNPFANGGIVDRPTAALIGEAGKEVVIPLTRPARAAQLAEQSGLVSLLASQGILGGTAAATTSGNTMPPVEMHVHTSNSDPEQVARRAIRIIERRLGGRGLERIS